ncbi:stage II sporulation protein M [Paenibacillus sp. NEAU-GSW1]|uniref:stage II sporulation protein M n=1 Tax=Paenibacillus sp. NEAU-GSW1 TaxID=2682486 RepID=UPI0020A6AB91|nr:stage II sporulation protein M [Paenibacillus sp. NEAU-GSW1]
MSGYISFGFILFAAGIVVGGTDTAFSNYLEQQLASLGGLREQLERTGNPTLAFMIFIFLNNAIKSILILYIGSLFGIVPIFFLVFNGMIIGFLLQRVAEANGTEGLLATLIGLLPHGIIEIPAIVIASAYGMKFGALVWKLLLSALSPRRSSGEAGRAIEFFVIRSVPVVVLLVVALLIAAVIESTVSLWLVSNY